MIEWRNVREDHAPIGEVVLICNEETGTVTAGYAEWGKAPFPYWIAFEATGVRRFKATHWAEMPPAFKQAEDAA